MFFHFQGAAFDVAAIDPYQQDQYGDGGGDQYQHADDEQDPVAERSLIALCQIVGGLEQGFTAAEDAGAGLLGQHQRLHVAENAGDGGFVLLEPG